MVPRAHVFKAVFQPALFPSVTRSQVGLRWASTAPPTAKPRSVAFRLATRLLSLSLYTMVAVTAGAITTMVTTVPADLLGLSFLSEKEGLLRFEPADAAAREVERQMNALPLVQKLRADPEMTECRPHVQMPEKVRETNLTGKTLVGANMLPTVPLTFRSKNHQEITTIIYLGHDLCGHPGIIHGGLLATILDEQSGFCCIPLMKQRMAVTAYLNINYRRPAKADNFFVVKTKLHNLDGRKAFVKSAIKTIDGKVVADADSLFIEPKWAAYMPRFMA